MTNLSTIIMALKDKTECAIKSGSLNIDIEEIQKWELDIISIRSEMIRILTMMSRNELIDKNEIGKSLIKVL